jgi:predicted RNA-binding protein associated with RNAse of E/G family
MAAGYLTVWFLFKERPYDVARVYRPDGTWTGYYADVLEPVRWQGDDPQSLEPIVDLFLDLWIGADGAYLPLDEDEFDDAVRQAWITQAQAAAASTALADMIQATRRGEFPPVEVRQFRGDP